MKIIPSIYSTELHLLIFGSFLLSNVVPILGSWCQKELKKFVYFYDWNKRIVWVSVARLFVVLFLFIFNIIFFIKDITSIWSYSSSNHCHHQRMLPELKFVIFVDKKKMVRTKDNMSSSGKIIFSLFRDASWPCHVLTYLNVFVLCM